METTNYDDVSEKTTPGAAFRVPWKVSLAVGKIRQMIEVRDLGPEGRLPAERDLSLMFGLGRHTIRRALEVLEADGLVWRQQGRGTFAGQPPKVMTGLAAGIADAVDAVGVMEARMGIEPRAAALCARRATAEDVDRLRVLARQTDQATGSDDPELWDGALHSLILHIADNAILSTAFALIDEVRGSKDWQHKRMQARTLQTKALCSEQHHAIIEAIAARDPDAAYRAMLEHLSSLTENLRQSLDAKL